MGALVSDALGTWFLKCVFARTKDQQVSSALEIVTKLCSPEFARKAKAADFYTRAWDVLLAAGAAIDPPTSTSAQHDKILSIILAFFSALVARDSGSLAELAERPERRHGISEVAESLTAILGSSISDREKDGLALVGAGVSDTELRAVGVARTEKPLVPTSTCLYYCSTDTGSASCQRSIALSPRNQAYFPQPLMYVSALLPVYLHIPK